MVSRSVTFGVAEYVYRLKRALYNDGGKYTVMSNIVSWVLYYRNPR